MSTPSISIKSMLLLVSKLMLGLLLPAWQVLLRPKFLYVDANQLAPGEIAI